MSPGSDAPSVDTPSLTADLESVVWAHRTSTLAGIAFRFAVRSDDGGLGRHVDRLLTSLRVPGAPRHRYSLVTSASGGIDLYLNDIRIAQLANRRDAIDWLLWDINRAAAEASGDHLLFHAGGVQIGDVGIMFPAPSGSGKSTLVTGLVRAGCAYLSDELIALTAPGSQLLPYPKPLALKAGSFAALRDLRPGPDSDSAPYAGEEWYLPIEDIPHATVGQRCDPRFVVVPQFSADAVTALTPMPRTEAFLALATNSVNLDDHGARGAQLLGDLVAQCGCYRLEISDLGQACHLVAGLVTEDGAPHVT